MIALYSVRLWDHLNKTKADHLLYEFRSKKPKKTPEKGHVFFLSPFMVVALFVLFFNPLSIIFIVNTLLSFILLLETIRRINNSRSYADLIGLTPLGRAGMYWLWIKRLTRTQSIFVILRGLASMFQTISFTALLCAVLLFIIGSFIEALEGQLRYSQGEPLVLLNVALFAGLVYVDYHYSFLLGALVGVLIPNYNSHPVISLLIALVLLGVIQMLAYLPLFIMGADVLSTLLILSFYLGAREIAILILWRRIEMQLNTDISELKNLDGMVTY